MYFNLCNEICGILVLFFLLTYMHDLLCPAIINRTHVIPLRFNTVESQEQCAQECSEIDNEMLMSIGTKWWVRHKKPGQVVVNQRNLEVPKNEEL